MKHLSLHPATFDPTTAIFRCTPPEGEPFEVTHEAVEDLAALATPRAPEDAIVTFDAATGALREVPAAELPFRGQTRRVTVETLDDLVALAGSRGPGGALKTLKVKTAAFDLDSFAMKVVPTEGAPFFVSLETLEDLLAMARRADPIQPVTAPAPAPSIPLDIDWGAPKDGPRTTLRDPATGQRYTLSDLSLAALPSPIGTPTTPVPADFRGRILLGPEGPEVHPPVSTIHG